MKISLHNGGKRFNREWIFRKATLDFSAPKAYAITGPNGSGKSTLLQVLAGMFLLSEGSIAYTLGQASLAQEEAYKQISFCAPYMDVIEEMTALEFLNFHAQFKPFLPTFSAQQIIEAVDLKEAANKQIRFYSSGMKQRIKLAQAFFSNTACVLLDEPCSNLDAKGIALYHQLVATYGANRLLVVCSNDEVEYRFCDEVLSITSFK